MMIWQLGVLVTALIIKHGAFGDFLLCIGTMQAIAAKYAETILITSSKYKEIAERLNIFKEIIIDDRPKIYEMGEFSILKNEIKKYAPFEMIYDLQWSRRTRMYFHFLFNRKMGPWVAPFKKADIPFVPKSNFRDTEISKATGLKITSPDLSMFGNISADIPPDPFFLLIASSSASSKGMKKRWPLSKYKDLADSIAKIGVTPVVLGATINGITSMESPSIDCLACLGRRAVGVVGNDTGPTHFLALIGCDIITLFGCGANPENVCLPDVRFIQKKSIDDIEVDEVLAML